MKQVNSPGLSTTVDDSQNTCSNIVAILPKREVSN